ncbi:SRPBCC family protein [Streptomyces roseirectus]|uniref:SRPBCC family protein n=1 Tax=Streptomyces roseirectus TaxID=2768066 RepID=A0A7H0I844_9ACTN|nr:SRPBCC family protein [Streptomyces roseirectus]QNP68960.1 SRPBCC family protein [Streptomyces roseirectus]
MGGERRWRVEESVLVRATPERAYRAISDVRRMGAFSPECVGVWVRRRGPVTLGTRFTGFNRKGPWLWFTDCRVVRADPARDFAFRVTSFGLPIALWGYRFTPEQDGTLVTEYWEDLRTGRKGRPAELLGFFTGTRPEVRHRVNAEGMRATLGRLKAELEG